MKKGADGIYKSEYFMTGNKKVKMSFIYPSGEEFGGFYEELTAQIKSWAEREYSEYSGRGMTYRFSASISHSDGILTSVLCRVLLSERGRGALAENVFAQNWVYGRLASLSDFIASKEVLRKAGKRAELFVLDDALHFVSNNGEMHKTDIKISDFTKKIPYIS